MSIKPLVITLGLAALALLPQSGHAAEDRCAALDAYGQPAHCSPALEGLAPIWEATACCRGSDCTLPDANGRCSAGQTSYWCEFAELDLVGKLTCLFEVQDFCSVTDCPPGDGGGEPMFVCCPYDDFEDCFEYHPGAGCDTIWYCSWGATNEDGSYACMEPIDI
ncbi:hypothetical protein ACNOYE_27545 [Nannocystaceae bacterium ST9]